MPTDVRTPDWVKDAIFYQIFPDRFAASATVAKPHNLEPWDSAPTRHGFKGGDLIGVIEHLDYLQELGINAIYLNPIFQSTANHRYHTHDYFQVDPILGGTSAFDTMLKAAHARGIRVILDGVFNHASRGFLQFNHALENGEASPYLDWFRFEGFPVRAYGGKPNYACWFNLPDLPKLNCANHQVQEYIFQIAEHWLERGADGWRLDVPEEIDDDEFWREFRRRSKRINPDAYIVGEIWHRADRWLQGDQFDGVMNYQFTRACLSFLVDYTPNTLKLTQPQSYGEIKPIDAVGFLKTLEGLLGWYPPEISLSQLNLLDSHDTARFVTIAGGDVSTLKLALLVLLTYPGVPMIYYGDEVGLEGGQDPDCRRSMRWDTNSWNRDLFYTTKDLIALRRKHPSLRRGRFQPIYAQGQVCAYARQTSEESMVIALNAGDESVSVDLPVQGASKLVEERTGEETSVDGGQAHGVRLEPRQGRVWLVQPA